MFRNADGTSSLRLHGGHGTLLLGSYHEAAVLSTWAIAKRDGEWRLRATVARVDVFQVHRKPLFFSAPRAGGFWSWPVQAVEIAGVRLRARLGPPEQ